MRVMLTWKVEWLAINEDVCDKEVKVDICAYKT